MKEKSGGGRKEMSSVIAFPLTARLVRSFVRTSLFFAKLPFSVEKKRDAIEKKGEIFFFLFFSLFPN